MAISKQYMRLIDEYLIDLNAQKAGERVGYSPKTARQTVYKALQKPEVKAELERRFNEGRMTPGEIVARLEDMAAGTRSTKRIETPSRTYGSPTVREEYDTRGALQDLGKVYALFVDKQIVENIGLEVIDDDEEIPDNQECDR